MAEERKKITAVFAGRRPTTKGTPGYLFVTEEMIEQAITRWKDQQERTGMQLNDAPTDLLENRGYLWGLKGANVPRTVGAVYSMDSATGDDGKLHIYPATIRFESAARIETHGLVTAWETMDRAVEQDKRRKAAEAKYAPDIAMQNAIGVMRLRYQRIPSGHRRPFVLWLIDQLEKR